MLWQAIIRRLLFCLPAERAHHWSMGVFNVVGVPPVIRLMRWRSTVADPRLRQSVFGLDFPNPVGLAAGFDKDARWFHQLPGLGFSHVEIGTVTGLAQSGNPQPRLFRLPSDQAIVNRMGFNNSGADALARRLSQVRKSSPQDILGINIGKSKVVPLGDATRDYVFSFERLFTYADYFAINVSSPNTPGLRELQNRSQLQDLLGALMELNRELAGNHDVAPKPILLKIAPDLTASQLDEIISIVDEVSIDGVIATNTTIARDQLRTPAARVGSIGPGGLSGRPLTERSRQVVRHLFGGLPKGTPIVGVGGIMDGNDAWRMILAGASLVQIYTGFVYGGPGTVRRINRYLAEKLRQNSLASISLAVGKRELEVDK
jgi:dihydroorotate dehydrogenase